MSESPDTSLDYGRLPASLRSRDVLAACFTFVVAFAVYLYTLAPTVTFGDSGELITAAYTLGVAHPPGYPLWVMLAKFFSLFPIGSVAYRINLMSAIFGAAAAALLALTISRTVPRVCARVISREAFESPMAGMITGSAAVTAALMLAFSPTFWRQSVVAEVYALNSFIVCVLLLIMALWARSPEKNGLLFATSLIFGAGLGNHHTLILMGPALALFVVLMRPRALLSPRLILGCAALFLLGLCLYAYLPLRAMTRPPLNWGNPDSWESFWFHLARKQYRVVEVMRPLSVLGPQIKFFFVSVAGESLPVVLLLPALLTAGFADRNGKLWTIFTVTAFVFTGVIFIGIANTELDLNAQDILKVYFLPAFILVALWLGYGIAMIGLLALRATRRLRLRFMPATAVAVLWLLLPATNLVRNYNQASMRRHDFALFYGETLLMRLESGALLLTGTDSGYAIPMYLKWVEGQRSDISILSINRLADQGYMPEAERNASDFTLPDSKDYEQAFRTQAGVTGSASSIYGSQILTRVNGYLAWRLRQLNLGPLYYDEGLPIEWMRDFTIPAGLVMELKSEPVEAIPVDALASDKDFWDTLELNLLGDTVFLSDIDARQKFSKCRSNIGALYLHRKMYAEAEEALEQAIRFSDRNMEAYAYLALMRKEQGRPEEAVQVFEDYMRRDPWNTSAIGFAQSLRR